MTNDSLAVIGVVLAIIGYFGLGCLFTYVIMKAKYSTVYVRIKNENTSFHTQRNHRHSI